MRLSLAVFCLYMVAMALFGVFTYRRVRNFSGYAIGERGINPWVTALSAEASDMSGWLLMGLPGAAFAVGLSGSMWMSLGLALGTLCNWLFVSRRLRRETEAFGAITLPDYFEARFSDRTHVLRVLSALLIFAFFVIYTSSGFLSGGKLFQSAYNIDFRWGVVISAAAIVIYTFLGGFLAVVWTDLVQAVLMFVALLIVPIVALFAAGGPSQTLAVVHSTAPQNLTLLGGTGGFAAIVTIALGNAAWGLGYFGQPHILTKFMAIKEEQKLRQSMVIAMIWVVLALLGGILAGFAGFAIAQQGALHLSDPETVIIALSNALLHPVVAGIVIAAIMAAIMSTISSFLLISSTVIAQDFYRTLFHRQASDRQLVWIGRCAVLVLAIVGVWLAFSGGSVLSVVSYAWAGLGATFGPLVLFSLFWRRTHFIGALAGMIVGAATVFVWANIAPLHQTIYELLPAFALSSLAIWLGSLLGNQRHTNQTIGA